MVRMNVFHGGKSIAVNVRKVGLLGMARGLMFKSSNTNNLLFEFSCERKIAIHSLFCKPFLAVWLDAGKRVTKTELIDKWRFHIGGRGGYLIEIPVNEKNKRIIEKLFGEK
jgi:uncharacterized membrane protein (UPF0127 family)